MLPNEYYAQHQFINGDTGQIQNEKSVVGNIILDYDNPYVVIQSEAEKFCVALPYAVGSKIDDYVFKLNNSTLAIKTFATVGGLAGYKLKDNEIAIITNDPTLRHVVWFDKSALTKNFYYEYKTIASVFSTVYMEEIAKKLNALNPSKIDSDISELKNRVSTAESRLDVIDIDLRELEEKVSSLDDRLTDTESKISVAEQNIQAINENIDLLEDSISNLKTKTDTLDTRTAGISRIDTTTTVADSLKAGGTLEVIGKSTLQDIEVKGNVIGALKDSEGYRYVKVRTGSIANSGRFKDMKFILQDGVATVNGNYDVAANQNVNTLDIYNFMADIIPPVIIKLNKINFYSTKKENEFYVNTTINDDTSFFINFRNTTGETKNIQYSTFNFVIECLIDVSSSNIIWD